MGKGGFNPFLRIAIIYKNRYSSENSWKMNGFNEGG